MRYEEKKKEYTKGHWSPQSGCVQGMVLSNEITFIFLDVG